MLDIPVTPTASASPFAALSLIAAPAILTNAASLLVMSTSNRLARAVDLARETARELEGTAAQPDGRGDADTRRRLTELAAAEERALLLLRALRAVYVALAGFATATLVSLLGVVFEGELSAPLAQTVEAVAIAAGLVAVGSIVWAASLLMRETRIAVAALTARVDAQQRRFTALAAGAPGERT